jgi:hypothetical protein
MWVKSKMIFDDILKPMTWGAENIIRRTTYAAEYWNKFADNKCYLGTLLSSPEPKHPTNTTPINSRDIIGNLYWRVLRFATWLSLVASTLRNSCVLKSKLLFESYSTSFLMPRNITLMKQVPQASVVLKSFRSWAVPNNCAGENTMLLWRMVLQGKCRHAGVET